MPNRPQLRAAVIGAGMLGIDLADRLTRSTTMACALVAGRRTSTAGLRLAARMGCATSADGIDVVTGAGIDVVFDASNAAAHPAHWAALDAAATGCRRSTRALWYPRAALAASAAAAGLPAIDSPYFDLEDPDGLQREAEEASDLGFAGKGAVHPRQLPLIREAFRPSARDLADAPATLTAADAAGGVTTAGGRMVGPPLVAAARAVTEQARSAPDVQVSKEVPGV
ncbi:hypothetical protein ACR820_05390 [Streptomyces netropsis]